MMAWQNAKQKAPTRDVTRINDEWLMDESLWRIWQIKNVL